MKARFFVSAVLTVIIMSAPVTATAVPLVSDDSATSSARRLQISKIKVGCDDGKLAVSFMLGSDGEKGTVIATITSLENPNIHYFSGAVNITGKETTIPYLLIDGDYAGEGVSISVHSKPILDSKGGSRVTDLPIESESLPLTQCSASSNVAPSVSALSSTQEPIHHQYGYSDQVKKYWYLSIPLFFIFVAAVIWCIAKMGDDR